MRALAVCLLLVPAFAGCISDSPSVQEVLPPPVATGASEEVQGEDAAASNATPEPEPPAETNATAPPPPEPEPEPEPAAAPPPPPPAPVVERRFGNSTCAGAATDAGHRFACHGDLPTATTTLPPGATALLVEVRWTSQVPADADLVLRAPDYVENVPPELEPNATAPQDTAVRAWAGHRWVAAEPAPSTQDGFGYARILVDDAAALALAGTWTVELGTKGPGVIAWEIAVTKASGAPLAPTHSAFR